MSSASGWRISPIRAPRPKSLFESTDWQPETSAIANRCVTVFGSFALIGGRAIAFKASISHSEAVIRELRENPAFAVEYLKAALDEADEPEVLLVALRRIAEARGGVAKVAKAAGLERESLYRALSARGNPRLSTLVAVTRAVGLRLTVENAQASH
jgi:probable addiction module antidote protein